ncbi:hypothetical protein FACS189440_20280 [Bacteroidia bacterium]|nr:hypothetical protein FACS189440_20280 [Bacteroidia bacterium]
MKMKKMIFLMLTLFFLGAASMNSQVRIGGTDDPNDNALLDLNETDASNDATKGLGLPRVALLETAQPVPLSSHVAGMMVYNTQTRNDVKAGVYFNDGGKWIPLLSDAAAQIPGSEPPIIFLRNPNRIWLEVNGSAVDTLGFELSAADKSKFTYQWYQRDPVTLNSTPVAGATNDSILINGSGTKAMTRAALGVTEEGKVYQYYCVVISGSQYAMSGTGRVVYGSGAYIANNGWLKLAPANLGANQTMTVAQQLAYKPDASNSGTVNDKNYDPDVYGDWYQWGRKKDNHQDRKTPSTGTYAGLLSTPEGLATTDLDAYGQVATTAVGQFIQRNGGTTYDWRQYPETADNSMASPANAWTWGDPVKGITSLDPCKAQNPSWRVPTQYEWAQLQANNTWVWKESGDGTANGYEIKPGGLSKATSLFLPAAGYRNRNGGAQYSVGANGHYWSSTPTSANAYNLGFNSTSVNAASTNNRSYGFTVRCIAE